MQSIHFLQNLSSEVRDEFSRDLQMLLEKTVAAVSDIDPEGIIAQSISTAATSLNLETWFSSDLKRACTKIVSGVVVGGITMVALAGLVLLGPPGWVLEAVVAGGHDSFPDITIDNSFNRSIYAFVAGNVGGSVFADANIGFTLIDENWKKEIAEKVLQQVTADAISGAISKNLSEEVETIRKRFVQRFDQLEHLVKLRPTQIETRKKLLEFIPPVALLEGKVLSIQHKMEFSDIQRHLKRPIGCGSFGAVYEASWKGQFYWIFKKEIIILTLHQ
jgi:hypothetical protein